MLSKQADKEGAMHEESNSVMPHTSNYAMLCITVHLKGGAIESAVHSKVTVQTSVCIHTAASHAIVAVM